MKLVDRDPRWIAEAGRHGMGVSFDCPCSKCLASDNRERLAVWFANPVDGGAAHVRTDPGPAYPLWQRTGETFEDLTLAPSIDASHFGHWHGHVRNGEIV